MRIYMLFHIRLIECMREYVLLCIRLIECMYLRAPGASWRLLGLSGLVSIYLGLSGPIWAYLGISGPIWPIWAYLHRRVESPPSVINFLT